MSRKKAYNEETIVVEKAMNLLQMNSFMNNLKELFVDKLKMDSNKDKDTMLKQANYLLLAKHGLAVASRVNTSYP